MCLCVCVRLRGCVYVCLFLLFFVWLFACKQVHPSSYFIIASCTRNGYKKHRFAIIISNTGTSFFFPHPQKPLTLEHTHTIQAKHIIRKEKWKSHGFPILRSVPVKQVLVLWFCGPVYSVAAFVFELKLYCIVFQVIASVCAHTFLPVLSVPI